jgi:hypothetical protein
VLNKLQRGRGPETAERLASVVQHPLRWECFNGAAVRRPRRASSGKAPSPALRASTGPRSGDRGERIQKGRFRAACRASTGPRSGDRGESAPVLP